MAVSEKQTTTAPRFGHENALRRLGQKKAVQGRTLARLATPGLRGGSWCSFTLRNNGTPAILAGIPQPVKGQVKGHRSLAWSHAPANGGKGQRFSLTVRAGR